MPKPFEIEIWGGSRKKYLRTRNLVNNLLRKFVGNFVVNHVPVDVKETFLRVICTGVHMGCIEDATMELGKLELKIDVLLRYKTIIV